jgi:hypothetical protein
MFVGDFPLSRTGKRRLFAFQKPFGLFVAAVMVYFMVQHQLLLTAPVAGANLISF